MIPTSHEQSELRLQHHCSLTWVTVSNSNNYASKL